MENKLKGGETMKATRIFLMLFICLFLIQFTTAVDSAITLKQNKDTNITLQITYADNSPATGSSSCYLTIQDNEQSVKMNYQQMSFTGNGFFTISLNGTSVLDKIGTYAATLNCDEGTLHLKSTFLIDVTPSGFQDTLGFYIILIVVAGAFIVLGFSIKDGWFIVAGGFGFMLIGLYSINFGIAGMRDMFITWGIGLFEIFMGGYLAIRAGLEVIDG